jgi:hypothetical protein
MTLLADILNNIPTDAMCIVLCMAEWIRERR